MKYKNARLGSFESLESKKLMTADVVSEATISTNQVEEAAAYSNDVELLHTATDNAQAAGPSSAEIKKHSSKTLKVGSKGDAVQGQVVDTIFGTVRGAAI